jgi:hypothetical protein
VNRKLFIAIFVPLGILLLVVATLSLQWRIQHDSALRLYVAYLIDELHYVPYRDFFDEQAPGVHFVYSLVGLVSQYSDLGFRIADMLALGTILSTTWLFMRHLANRQVAWCAAIIFGLAYLQWGPAVSMEKEFLTILPISIALLVVMSFPRWSDRLRGAAVGFLFAVAGSIKPQAAIGFPLVLAFHAWSIMEQRGRKPRQLLPFLLSSAVGFAGPLLAMVVYLWHNGALPSLIDIAAHYWPLYAELTGSQQMLSGPARLPYLVNGYLTLGGHRWWLLPAVVGTCVSLCSQADRHRKRQVLLLVGMALAYSLSAVAAGKFWNYHWLPFQYFVILVASLCLVELPRTTHRLASLLPPVVLLLTVCLCIRPPREFYAQARGRPLPPPKAGRVDEMASYLKSHLKDGDKVQPLDWTGGAVQAMLMTRAQPATPFIYDVLFYHHVSHPYVQGLRRRFIEDLRVSQPRFIIEVVSEDKPWVWGEDTTREFPELRSLLAADYTVTLRGEGFVAYERGAGAEAALEADPLARLTRLLGSSESPEPAIVVAPGLQEHLQLYPFSDRIQFIAPDSAGDASERDVDEWLTTALNHYDRVTLLYRGDKSQRSAYESIHAWLNAHAYPNQQAWYGKVWAERYVLASPGDEQLTDIRFSHGLHLVSSAMSTLDRRDGVSAVRLEWLPTDAVPGDYCISVQVLSEDGQLATQSDIWPEVPTSQWKAGEPVVTKHGLIMPADLAPGSYRVQVVLYDSSGTRLQVSGQGDAAQLGELLVGD